MPSWPVSMLSTTDLCHGHVYPSSRYSDSHDPRRVSSWIASVQHRRMQGKEGAHHTPPSSRSRTFLSPCDIVKSPSPWLNPSTRPSANVIIPECHRRVASSFAWPSARPARRNGSGRAPRQPIPSPPPDPCPAPANSTCDSRSTPPCHVVYPRGSRPAAPPARRAQHPAHGRQRAPVTSAVIETGHAAARRKRNPVPASPALGPRNVSNAHLVPDKGVGGASLRFPSLPRRRHAGRARKWRRWPADGASEHHRAMGALPASVG